MGELVGSELIPSTPKSRFTLSFVLPIFRVLGKTYNVYRITLYISKNNNHPGPESFKPHYIEWIFNILGPLFGVLFMEWEEVHGTEC